MMYRRTHTFALLLTGLIGLPLATAAGATWNGGTDTWTDSDNGPWSGSAPAAGDAVNLTQSTTNDITITYEAGHSLTGDESTEGTRFGDMEFENTGGGTTTLLLDNSDDNLPTAGRPNIRGGANLRVEAGTFSPDEMLEMRGGSVVQTGGLIQPRRWDLNGHAGSYTINGGESNYRKVVLTGNQGAFSMTVNSGATLTQRDAGNNFNVGNGNSPVTFTLDGGTVNASGDLNVRANGTVEIQSGDMGDPNNNAHRFLSAEAGVINQSGGNLNIRFEQRVGHVQNQSATYNLSGGTSTARNMLLGTSGQSGGSAGGAGTLNHTGGTLTIDDGVFVGHASSTGTSRYILKGGQLGDNDGFPLNVRSTGVFEGYGTPDSGSSHPLNNSGRIIADGDGTERTLDLREFGNNNTTHGGAENPTDNPADGDNGYFATEQGKLVLPDVLNVASSNGSTYNFGESQSDTTIDLINSARFTFNGLDDSGQTLTGSLLDPARSDVTTNGLDLISVHDFDLTGDSSVFDSFDLTIRYDQTALESGEESILRLMHFDGSNWVDITSSRDTANNLITANGVDSFSQFGVTAVIPEPASLALLAPGGLLIATRRRRR